MVNDRRYFVSYEGMPNICSGCGIYGHLVHPCPKRVHELTAAVATMKVVETPGTQSAGRSERQMVVGQGTQDEDGYTLVRKNGLTGKKTAPVNQRAVVLGKPMEGEGRNLRDITGGKDSGAIVISNRFGGLDTVMENEDLRNNAVRVEGNKENQNIENIVLEKKSTGQAKGMIFGANSGFITGRASEGNNEKKMTNRSNEKKMNRPNWAKMNKPGRGLVFGPGRNEEVLSSSGKRLRVETGSLGRQGGVFTQEKTGEVEIQRLDQTRSVDDELAKSGAEGAPTSMEEEQQLNPASLLPDAETA